MIYSSMIIPISRVSISVGVGDSVPCASPLSRSLVSRIGCVLDIMVIYGYKVECIHKIIEITWRIKN